MAHCVISAVCDTDDPSLPVHPACVVHAHWAPCPLDGQPANPAALHTDNVSEEDGTVRRWQLKTHGQRGLVIHHGLFTESGREHVVTPDSIDCWCRPAVHHAQDCGCRGEQHA